MNRNHIVSVDPDFDTPDTAVCTPDKVLTLIEDTVQWFSNHGPHGGKIIDEQGSPFESNEMSWSGGQGQASKLLKVNRKGVFKYEVQVTVKDKVFKADPEVIGT